MVRCECLSIVIKESFIDIVSPFGYKSEFETLKHIDKNISVNELNGWNPVAPRFFLGFKCERASGDDYAFVGTAHHGASKIAHMRRSDSPLVSLALEEDIEAHEGINLQSPNSVYPSVSCPASDRHVLKARLTKQSLA